MAIQSETTGVHCPRCNGHCMVKKTTPDDADPEVKRRRQCRECELLFPTLEIIYPPPIEDAAAIVLASVHNMETLWTTEEEKELLQQFLGKFGTDLTRLEEIESFLLGFKTRFRKWKAELQQVESSVV